MKQAMIGAAFCAILLTLPARPQTPDTTSAWRYYPLQVGNVWEYRGTDFSPADFRIEIIGDTLIEGARYFLEASAGYSDGELGPYSSFPIRFDTTTANVLARWEDGSESVWHFSGCPLNAPFGAEVKCLDGSQSVGGGYAETVEFWSGLVFENVTYKEFFTPPYDFVNAYIAGIGWVYSRLGVEPGERVLSYARIDGVEYGEPFPVAAEPAAPEERTFALAVYPNPAQGPATVRFSLDRPQRVQLSVHDVLGRRVLSRDLGVQPAGEGSRRLDLAALPAGVYVVRLDGDAGARAVVRIVHQ